MPSRPRSRSRETALQHRAARQTPNEDRELAAGSSAHYEDADYYQRTYARRREDVEFYVALAGTLSQGRPKRKARTPLHILEYGCGNGRIGLPLAREGHSVVGVDLSASMLADFDRRLASEPDDVRARIRTRRADMRKLRLRARFGLVICPFNTFLHLYTRGDVEQHLAAVRSHLAPGGRFALDVSIPDPSELARPPDRLFKTRPFFYPGVGTVSYGERFDYDRLRQVLFVSMEFTPQGKVAPFSTPLAHRQFYPQELEALLHYNGFSIEEQVGDWDGKPTHESRHLAIVAQVRGGAG